MSFWGLLLLPLTVLYSIGIRLRNHLFDIEYSRSFEFDIPVICVGNLSAGGTGKSPMVEFLVKNLVDSNKLAVLSRGYRRKTKGFRLASGEDSPETIGDEPYQLYSKLGTKITVAVGEDRALAIPQIIYYHQDTDLIILDDGFQHRSVKPKLSIVLTSYDRLFTQDYLLPSGRLREPREEIKRADIVVVTKCSSSISRERMREISSDIQDYGAIAESIYFSKVIYGPAVYIAGEESNVEKVYAIAGLANNEQFFDHCSTEYGLVGNAGFEDHHFYTTEEMNNLLLEAQKNGAEAVVTTEKDSAKIQMALGSNLILPVFYLPINIEFIENEARFLKQVKRAI